MTEKQLWNYSELKDGSYGVFKDKYYSDNDISFSQRFCVVENEEQARSIVGQLNGLVDENEQLKEDINYLEQKIKEEEWHWNTIDEDRDVWMYKCNQLEKENEELKQELFEARKDYLIETADISDKLYLEDEIEQERKEIFGG